MQQTLHHDYLPLTGDRLAAAEQRAADLAKANLALQATIDALSQAGSLDQMVPLVLQIVARTFGASSCAVFRNDPAGRVFLQFWFVEGKTFLPHELVQLDSARFGLIKALAEGFEVPDDYLGKSPVHMIGPVILNHFRGTSVPEFDHFAVGNAWDLELNIGVGAQGNRAFTLCIYRSQERPFSDHEIALGEALAKQIGLAMEIAGLAGRAQQAAAAEGRETQAKRISEYLVRTVAGLSGASDLSAALASIIKELALTIGAAHVFMLRHDTKTDTLRLQLSYVDGKLRWGPSGEEMLLFAGPFPSDITPAWKIMCQNRRLFTPEDTIISAEEFGWPGAFDYVRRFALSDVAHTVLFAGDLPIGSIGLGFRGGQKLHPSDRPFIEAAAQQAAIAIRMLDLGEEAKQAAIAREQERAAYERATELAKANATLRRGVERLSGAQDIDTILGAFLMEAVSTCEANSGAVFTTTGRGTETVCRVVAGRSSLIDQSETTAWTEKYPQVSAADELGIFKRLLSEGLMVVPLDTSELTEWFPELADYHSRSGEKTAWATAIRIGARALGFLGLAFREHKEPTAITRETLEALTQQAALALEITRLADENKQAAVLTEREHAAHRRLAELTKTTGALKQTLDVMAFEPDLNKVLGHVLVAITKQLDSPSSALWLFNPAFAKFNVHLIYHAGNVLDFKQSSEGAVKAAWGRGGDLFLKTHIDERRPTVYQVESLKDSHSTAYAFFRKQNVNTLLGIPLLLSSEIVGSLTIRFDRPRHLSAEELELTQAMAHQATLAIQLTKLAARAGESALIEERIRFSRDVHDTLAQGFTGILMQLGAASQVQGGDMRLIEPHLKAIGALARASLAEARRSVRALRPSPAVSDSLMQTVDYIVGTIRAQTEADLAYTVDGIPEALGTEVETELGRIVQESLHNVVKHAAATRISLSMEFQGGRSIRICVKDDGLGFDSSQKPVYGKFGLVGMQERAASIGASLTIISEKGRGTQIVLQHSEASRS